MSTEHSQRFRLEGNLFKLDRRQAKESVSWLLMAPSGTRTEHLVSLLFSGTRKCQGRIKAGRYWQVI